MNMKVFNPRPPPTTSPLLTATLGKALKEEK